jgi:hypothetical protein
MTLMTRIIADKTPKDQRQSALSAPSAFYEAVIKLLKIQAGWSFSEEQASTCRMNAVISYPN